MSVLAWTFWMAGGAVVAMALWHLPYFINRCERQRRAFAGGCDHFYRAAWPLLNDPRTSPFLLAFLHSLSKNLNNPSLVRKLLWLRLTGQMQAHASNPSVSMRDFAEAWSCMPAELQPRLAEAIGVGLVANALSGGLLGELFLRLMIPNRDEPQEVAAQFAPEMAPLLAA